MRHVGVMVGTAENDPEGQARLAAFREGLQQHGWTEGHNLKIEARWPGADTERLRNYAEELAAMSPDAIFCAGTASCSMLKQATLTVPIVFAQVTDPIATGFVRSLAHPGGNITGYALYEFGIGVKWPELLKQIAPDVARVAAVYHPALPSAAGYLRDIETAAPSLGLRVLASAVRTAAEMEKSLATFASEPRGGIVVLPGPFTTGHRDLIITLAARHRLPAIYPYRYFVTIGGLASYGTDNHDLSRRAAAYVARILKGEKPGDLPVQLADKFELVINLKTAKALGLDPPISLLARTDEVIE